MLLHISQISARSKSDIDNDPKTKELLKISCYVGALSYAIAVHKATRVRVSARGLVADDVIEQISLVVVDSTFIT